MTNGDAAEASTSKAKVNGKKAAVESDSDDSIDDDSDDDEAEVDEDFRNELLAALEAGGVSEALDNALDVEEDPDAEEELLNDDQMMAMDEKLAEIFRLQSGGKKGKKGQSFVFVSPFPVLTLDPGSATNGRSALPSPYPGSPRIARQATSDESSPRLRHHSPLPHRSTSRRG